MEVIICPSAERANHLTAQLIADTVKAKPNAVLGMATGRTPEGVYARLAQLHKEAGLDFSGVTTFNLDEYIGIPVTHPQSFRACMERDLFSKVNIKKENTHLPDGMAADLDAECERYERAIAAAGGIDLQLLGIGLNGHLAFNEPLSSLASRTRTKALTPETRRQNSPAFGSLDEVPTRAMTMGVGTVLESRWAILLATGSSKAEIILKAVEGPMSAVVTASALQMHRRCTVIVDEPAAEWLQMKEYYRWVFANEPEWAPYRKLVLDSSN
jgi:glucosamine-6-phosphate deaminase